MSGEVIRCQVCRHHIDGHHGPDGCDRCCDEWERFDREADHICIRLPSEIARDYFTGAHCEHCTPERLE